MEIGAALCTNGAGGALTFEMAVYADVASNKLWLATFY